MAVRILSEPSSYGRIYDTNVLNYKVSGSSYLQSNFQYQFRVYNSSDQCLGTFRSYPDSSGYSYFNPSSVIRNYLSYDFNFATGNTLCSSSFGTYYIKADEMYGIPPVVVGTTTQSSNLMVYNGCQMHVPYSSVYGGLNLQWVMTGSTFGTFGKFLTDQQSYSLDGDEYAYLYYITYSSPLPTRIKYTYWYRDNGTIPDKDYRDVINDQINSELKTQGMTKAIIGIDVETTYVGPPEPTPIPVGNGVQILSACTYEIFSASANSMYKCDIGPATLSARSKIPAGWLYYKVDVCNTNGYNDYCYSYTISNNLLMPIGSAIYEAQTENVFVLLDRTGGTIDSDVYKAGIGKWSHRSGPIYYSRTSAGETILNSVPFWVYRKCKSDKYDKYSLYWLNKHGGFDTYTFTQKNDIDLKIAKKTYKQRLQPDYSSFDAGEKIYSTDVETTYTLRSDFLTQKESQMMADLVGSPVVFLLKKYTKNYIVTPYAIPVIVINDSYHYEQVKNTKVIWSEIKIREANENIIQTQ